MSGVPLLGRDTAKQLRSGFREWYQDNRRRQIRSWGLFGACVGLVLGKVCRLWRLASHVYGDHILITEYYVDKSNAGQFEALWNEQAKLTQRCDGYQGTKLFKVLNRDWPAAHDGHQFSNVSPAKQDYVAHQSEDRGHVTESPPNLTETQRFPFQYLQVRSWNCPEAEKRWRSQENIQQVVEKMESTCWKVDTREYGTIADDKIKRLIW